MSPTPRNTGVGLLPSARTLHRMTTVPIADYFQTPFPNTSLGNRFGILPNSKYYGSQGHRGQDWVQPGGTPIPNIAAGLVVDTLWSDVLGNMVIVRHNPATGPDVYSNYCHLSRIGVRQGQVLKRGQTIGKVGTTGSASSGNHLHLAMALTELGGRFGTVFDPLAYINDHVKTAAGAGARPVKAKYTTARRGEGLYVIAARTGTTFGKLVVLNPNIKAPDFVVSVGGRVRVA